MADDKKLQDLARNNPNKFEEYYKQNVDKNASGATIAGKQSYYKNLDLSSSTSSGASSASDELSGGGGSNCSLRGRLRCSSRGWRRNR